MKQINFRYKDFDIYDKFLELGFHRGYNYEMYKRGEMRFEEISRDDAISQSPLCATLNCKVFHKEYRYDTTIHIKSINCLEEQDFKDIIDSYLIGKIDFNKLGKQGIEIFAENKYVN